MTFILNKNIALRSWWRVPYAYYVKGRRDAQRLTKDKMGVDLSKCLFFKKRLLRKGCMHDGRLEKQYAD